MKTERAGAKFVPVIVTIESQEELNEVARLIGSGTSHLTATLYSDLTKRHGAVDSNVLDPF